MRFPKQLHVALLVSLLVPIAQMRAQTQAAINATARSDFRKADADLNQTYRAVLAKLPDVASKQKLREKQRAWLASRDAEAARAAGQAEGGSMAPTIRYETAILYAHSEGNGGEAAALFTPKFDEAGELENHQDASDVQERDRCSE